jgi:hypothetical protein
MKKCLFVFAAVFVSLIMRAQNISVYPPSQNQYENIGQVVVPVFLSAQSANATSVDIKIVPANTTATHNVDYYFNDTTITWPANTQGYIQVYIQVVDDNVFEPDETLSIVVTNPTNGAAVTDSNFVLHILNNDTRATGDCNNLFFSEYVEGTNNNKAIEIYNPTTSDIDLSNYSIFKSTDGGVTESAYPLSGIVNAGGVFVVANPSANAGILNEADITDAFFDFNGNDALALLNVTDTIDAIGKIGENPGTGWPVGTGSTANNTLERSKYIYQGNTDWNTGATEWKVMSVDNIDSLGTHHTAPCGSPEPATLSFVKVIDTIAEQDTLLRVVIKVDNPSNVSADYSVVRDDVNSTATAGNDFIFTNKIFSHGMGVTYDTVDLNILDDALIESTEFVLLRFANTSSNVVISPDSLFYEYITDSDVLTVSFLGAGFSYSEDSTSPIQVKVVLSTPANDTVRVSVNLDAGSATKGTDFLFNDTTITFMPFSSDTQGVWVTILNDNIVEGNEQINFNLVDEVGPAVLGITAYTFTIIDDDFTGISAISLDDKISTYPNPARNVLNIKTELDLPDLSIVDLAGRIVMHTGTLVNGNNPIDISALNEGMYFLTTNENGITVSKRFVKSTY